MSLSSIKEAIRDYQAGKFVIIVDDEDRENEGDLVMASQFITPEAINFMTQYARGLICVAMEHRMIDRLRIPMMVPPEHNKSGFGTGFTLSVEARQGVSTGISAHDRARTISVLADPRSTPDDIVMPGHIFPLRAHPGGVLARRGQTEASVDLAILSGLIPSGTICEVMSADGTMARLPELIRFGRDHGIRIISVEDMVQYRRKIIPYSSSSTAMNSGVIRAGETKIPMEYGDFQAIAYRDLKHNQEHLVLYQGDLSGPPPLVRLHSACLTGDLFGSKRCDCGQQLQMALKRINEEGRGLLIYLQQEGRGIGLANKLRAYALQDQGYDTVDANLKLGFAPDCRSYTAAAAILKDLGISTLRLMTNNPLKVKGLESHQLEVIERLPHEVEPQAENLNYLRTKARRMSHILKCAG